MATEDSFHGLIRRVRAGDEAAAAEVVRRYEPELRRLVRVRLAGSGLRRLADSAAVVQSVLANFFVRAASGQFDLGTPEQLHRLLTAMARNKFNDLLRKQRARRRSDGRGEDGRVPLEGVADAGATPSRTVAARELLEAVRGRLSERERFLAEQRALGRDRGRAGRHARRAAHAAGPGRGPGRPRAGPGRGAG